MIIRAVNYYFKNTYLELYRCKDSDTYTNDLVRTSAQMPVYFLDSKDIIIPFTSLSEFYVQVAYCHWKDGVINSNEKIFSIENRSDYNSPGTVIVSLSNYYTRFKVTYPETYIDMNKWIYGRKYYVIETYVKLDEIAGVIEIRLDGDTYYRYDGNTATASNANCLCLYMGVYDIWYANHSFDDIIINDTTGSYNNSWMNGAAILSYVPTNYGDYNEFSPATVNNYTLVDETNIQSANDYVYPTDRGKRDLYNISFTNALIRRIDALITRISAGYSSFNHLKTYSTNGSISTTTKKIGTGSAYKPSCYISDTDLSTDFPLKSGTANKQISFAAWVLLTSKTTNYLITKCNRNSSICIRFSLGHETLSPKFNYGYTSTNYETYTISGWNAATEPATRRWYHVAFTLDGTSKNLTIRIWDDSLSSIVVDVTYTFTNTIYLTTTSFQLGTNGDEVINGYMDDVLIFNDILSTEEIDQIRSGTYDFHNDPNCIAYYPFDSTYDNYYATDVQLKHLLKVNGSSTLYEGSIITLDTTIKYPYYHIWETNPYTSARFLPTDIKQGGFESL